MMTKMGITPSLMPDCQQQYPFKIRALHCAFKDRNLYGRDAIVGGMLLSVIALCNSNLKQYLILGVRATRPDVAIDFEFSQSSHNFSVQRNFQISAYFDF